VSGERAQCVIPEWGECLVASSLSEADRRLVASLAAGEPRVAIDELVTGVRVRASAWVGVLRFEAFDVQVVPKLAGENLGLVRLLEFTTGISALRRAAGRRELRIESGSLFDLIVALFVEETERIIRGGLRADYVEVEEDLPILRGRLLIREQLLRRHGLPDRLECRFEERSHDVLDNRVLAAAAERAARWVGDQALRRRARVLVEVLSDVCSWEAFDAVEARHSVTYERLNDHYRDAHELAWLIFDDAGIEDLFSYGARTSFAFLIDMNRLFERFLEKFARLALGESWQTETQRRRSIVWDAAQSRWYSTIRPDIVVSRLGDRAGRVTVDAKYKLYGERNVTAGDVAQSFVYAYAHSRHGVGQPSAVIAHPSSTGEFAARTLEIRRQDALAAAELVVAGIPIPRALDECTAGERGPVMDGFRDVVDAALVVGEPVAA
jgi:5-methylcytosine-specific restriction enzyme subunit McrC